MTAKKSSTVNVRIAGLGGQGVLTAANILGEVAFRSDRDVKKAEVHGMAQRGGSLSCDVRFGNTADTKVASPMIPSGEVDYLVVFAPEWEHCYTPDLNPESVVISAANIDTEKLPNIKGLNVALMGKLSTYLDLPASHWEAVLTEAFPQKLHASNQQAFAVGRQS